MLDRGSTPDPSPTATSLADLARAVGAAGRVVPEDDLLGATAVAFRALLWDPAPNQTDDDGEPLPDLPRPWPVPRSFPGRDVQAVAAAFFGVELAASRTPAPEVTLGPLPQPSRREALRVEACRFAVAHGRGGIEVAPEGRLHAGRQAVERAAALVEDPTRDGTVPVDWEGAAVALPTFVRELAAGRHAAAVFLEGWANEREERRAEDAPRPELLLAAAAAYRAVAAQAREALGAIPDTAELLSGDSKQRAMAALALRGVARAEAAALDLLARALGTGAAP